MNNLVKVADEETRALNEEETTKFEGLQKEVADIDKTLKLAQEERKLMSVGSDDEKSEEVDTKATAQAEERAFANFLRTGETSFSDVETRSDVNLSKGDNGVVIPSTIASRIISTVKSIAPIIQNSDFYDVKGDWYSQLKMNQHPKLLVHMLVSSKNLNPQAVNSNPLH